MINKSENSLILPGKLDENGCVFIIDTGATKSIVRRDILTNQNIVPMPNTRVTTATGQTARLYGEVQLNVCIGQFQLKENILVADIVDDFILGLDIMEKHGFVLDLGQKTLRIDNEEITLRTSMDPLERVCLLSVETVRIPSNSEKIIWAKLEGERGGFTAGIAEPEQTEIGIIVAKTLINMDQNKIPIRVINPNKTSVTIQQEKVLGNCEPVVCISRFEDETGNKGSTTLDKEAVLKMFESDWEHDPVNTRG